MKTLLLLVLLQIANIFALSPEKFIDKPISDFTDYCIENKIDLYTGYQNGKHFYKIFTDKTITICFYDGITEALKIYYPKCDYNIIDIENKLKNSLYSTEYGIYINIDNPDIFYKLIDYENEAYFALLIYKQRN